MRIAFLANRRFQRDRDAHDFERLANLPFRNIHLLGNFRRRGLASQGLNQAPRRPNHFVHYFGHMYRQPNGASLICNRAADCLANPPRRISRKFVATAILEFIDRFHQANIAFLDEVKKVKPAIGIFLCDRNHQSQIGLNHLVLCLIGIHLTLNYGALHIAYLGETHSGIAFQLL